MRLNVIASRYRVLRKLGQGGMGEVFKVRHQFTGEVLALKILGNDLLKREEAAKTEKARNRTKNGEPGGHAEKKESQWAARFKREMQISARIGSEHVVRITDADVAPELEGAYFYVMELLNGADLERLLRDRGAFSREETVWIIEQIAQGLEKAHAIGIVHRDLKPANLFLHIKQNGALIAKLLDFGLAFLRVDAPDSLSGEKLTETGASLGTLNYFAPEQATGERELIGPATDIWALGVITFELLTGETYFPGREPSILFKIAHAQLTEPSHRFKALPASFDRWFYRSCERDPRKRWNSVSEQATELAKALGMPDSLVQSAVAPISLTNWAAARLHEHTEGELDAPEGAPASTAEDLGTTKPIQQALTAVTPALPTNLQRMQRPPLALATVILVLGVLALAMKLFSGKQPTRETQATQAPRDLGASIGNTNAISDVMPRQTAERSKLATTPAANVSAPARSSTINAAKQKSRPKSVPASTEFRPRAP